METVSYDVVTFVPPTKLIVSPLDTDSLPESPATNHEYVPGIEATVAQVLDLVKYLSPVIAVPSTAVKSTLPILTSPVASEFVIP